MKHGNTNSFNIRLSLAYDGTKYKGWQNIGTDPSIEGTLQRVLEQIFQTPITLQAASRTDAGVHAQGQVVNFLISKETIDLRRLQRSLNGMLPPDISVTNISFASDAFHPTLQAKEKDYHYHICYGAIQLPHHRHFSWHYPCGLKVDMMKEAASKLIGEHDFAAFCNRRKGQNTADTIRTVKNIDILELENQRLKIIVSGQNFLYKMVRNIVGTLIYIGSGKIEITEIDAIFNSEDRKRAGITAPAHGLILVEVRY